MTRSRLAFATLMLAMLFLALAPGAVSNFVASGDNAHAFAFLVVPFTGAMAWPRVPLLLQFLAYAALGGAIEIMQWLIQDWHQAEWGDWFVDMAAAAVALGLVALVRRLRLARP